MDRYSNNLPDVLEVFYKQALANSDSYLLQQAEIALIEAQIQALLSSEIQCADTWKRLQQESARLRSCIKSGDSQKLQKHLGAILKIIDEGSQLSGNRLEVNKLIKEKSKLIADERRRLVEAREYINRQQAVAYATGLIEAIRRHVEDSTVLKAIAADFNKSMSSLIITQENP